jgi:hypothetical protein
MPPSHNERESSELGWTNVVIFVLKNVHDLLWGTLSSIDHIELHDAY